MSTARTRIERQFEPEAVRGLKETSGSDLSIGGAGIAAEAFGTAWSTSALEVC